MVKPNSDPNVNQRIYDTRYSIDSVLTPTGTGDSYFDELAKWRVEAIRANGRGARAVDLCCGPGEHLDLATEVCLEVIGMDFSRRMLRGAQDRTNALEANRSTSLMLADARAIPLRSASVDLLFAYASLYYIPDVEGVVREVGRVVRPKGRAILEFGNWWSLNTIAAADAYHQQGIAKPFHIPFRRMKRSLKAAGLDVIEHRAFQLLPMWWGGGRLWTRALGHPQILRLMSKRVGGRMVDEWLAGSWPLKYFAFRHFFVCEKK